MVCWWVGAGAGACLMSCVRELVRKLQQPLTPPYSFKHSSCHTQPCFVFVGDVFENDPTMRQVKSLLLDFFRGRQVRCLPAEH